MPSPAILKSNLKWFAPFLLLFLSLNLSVSAQSEKFDILIRNAAVFDGDGFRPLKVDVGILGDRIVAVGDLKTDSAGEVIDAKGLVLSPGFIDAHTHSDFNPLVYDNLPNKILQGVTTEVVGNCGMSAAPLYGEQQKRVREVWAREGVQIETPDWKSFADYKKALLKKGMQTNFSALVGHGNLRTAVMGLSARPASTTEILEMRKMLKRAMNEGAAGISFGLIYLPGLYAQKEELTGLCREAAAWNGICAFHMRSEGSNLVESIREVVEIARETKARVQISHLKAGGRKNWDKIDAAFAEIEKGRQEGLDIQADAYPYTATSAELGIILPDKIFQLANRDEIFRDPSKREELLEDLRHHYQARDMKWDTVMIGAAAKKKYESFEGKTILEISRKTGTEPEKILVDLLVDNDFEISAFSFSQSEAVVSKVESQTYVSVGSDSVADGSRKPHPRAFGTFPKMFRLFVREKRSLQLGELIHKMTAMPADHFLMKDRGRVKPGYFADLVLFDAGAMNDRADYEKSTAPAEGVKWVFINGKAVVRDGEAQKSHPGRVLAPGV